MLVVGVNDEKGIIAVKGPPVLTTDERCALINSCKWVKECVPSTPYSVNE